MQPSVITPLSSRVTVCTVALGLLAGCTLTPNGETFTGSPVGRTVYLSGYALDASTAIRVQVLDPADQDPDDANATWTNIGTTYSSASSTNWQGDDLYPWSINVVPVPYFWESNRWPDGGLARFRLLYGTEEYRIPTFDDDRCLSDAILAGDDIGVIFNNCQSHDMPILTFVDEDPVAPSSIQYLSRRAGHALSEGNQYYNTIGAPSTLNAYKAARGFPSGEVVAKYYNAGDLGIGRDMHCRDRGSAGISCYVSNYGTVADNATGNGLQDQASALADTIAGHNNFATVVMDYFPNASSNDVRFYVYDANDNLTANVTLDSEGQKPFPGLCLSCHGGYYNSSTNTVTGAKFLPFDMDAFRYSGTAPWRRNDQQSEFRRLNAMVKKTNPTPSINQLIDGWYSATGGVNNINAVQDSDWMPAGWASEKILYHKAYKPFCRTCHVAVGFPMDTAANFKAYGIENAVCNGKYMPHAEVTRKVFWESSGRAHIAGALNLATTCN